jgi:hypothetical protein
MSIAYGQTVNGTHDASATVNLYSFAGATGDRVLVRLTSQFLPSVSIRQPDGTALCSTDNPYSGALSLECVLGATGAHTITVTDRNYNQIGTYSVSLYKLNPPSMAVPIVLGQTFSGTHNAPAEISVFTFNGSSGDHIHLQLTSAFLPVVSVRRPDGTQVCGADNPYSGSLTLDCILNTTGSHTLLVTDRNYNQTGAFTGSLQLQ